MVSREGTLLELNHMSVVLVPAKMAGDQEQFQQLLTGLLSVDNKIRQQAEVSTSIKYSSMCFGGRWAELWYGKVVISH